MPPKSYAVYQHTQHSVLTEILELWGAGLLMPNPGAPDSLQSRVEMALDRAREVWEKEEACE